MTSLPVIVGFGGYNAAGRSSFHHGYRRLIIDSLDVQTRQQTLANLAVLMGLVSVTQSAQNTYEDLQGNELTLEALDAQYGDTILDSTLVRRIESSYFDVDASRWQQSVIIESSEASPIEFELPKKQLPSVIPDNWHVEELDARKVKVQLRQAVEVKLDSVRDFVVKGAGQFPTGFEPSEKYASRFHPRSLQMAILGASDAINSTGIPWQTIADSVQPDEIAVYSSNIMGQLDEAGLGGMLQSRLQGKRITSKQCPLGHNSMTADFINAYVLGSVGGTASITGACASFLYNLKAGIDDIQSGRRKVVLVGNSETPITPEIMDGYASMGALATAEGISKLDEDKELDLRRSSRPFSTNCGFTIAESSQYTLLMDDQLAVELGAKIYGAVTDVFVNADGLKKSISTTGAGNMITMAKAVSSAVALLGKEAVQKHSFIQAHGSSTPLNRVTESQIYHQVAQTFGIEQWPVAAIKSYLGHSLATASGDQLVVSLGVFEHGVLPKISGIDHIAQDVLDEHLDLPMEHIQRAPEEWKVAFLNSKGFGGNNASAVVLSPFVVKDMLKKRYGADTMEQYESRVGFTQEVAQAYDLAASNGELNVIYRYGEAAIDESKVEITEQAVSLPGYAQAVALPQTHTYADLLVAATKE
ncbi:beta-ketoacyl-ACP synthase FabY [Oceaniserpentilla sp. 4NH20-0058]|uniref:beta-ketoacyl synthase n=1 Tax=Oceaniserpentilla sp. 4NH20-0058 TaxID=3127660 RepID=UPI003107BA6F